jgi:hypothetical protein
MSVVSIKEGFSGVTADGDNRAWHAVRVFTLLTDNSADRGIFTYPLVDPAFASIHDGTEVSHTIPAMGTAHPDNGYYVSRVPKVTKKGPRYFEVQVPYDSGDPAINWKTQNPFLWPAQVSWDAAEYEVPYEEDMYDPSSTGHGTPTLYTDGSPVDPPMTKKIHDPLLIIERIEASFTPSTAVTYTDTVCNDSTFAGALAGQPRMNKIAAKFTPAATSYWTTRYEIQFRMILPPGVDEIVAWNRRILNRPSYYTNPTLGKDVPNVGLRACYVGDSDPSLKNQLCPRASVRGADIFLSFQEMRQISWSSFGFGL